MNVPLLDLKAQYLSIKPEIDAAIAEVVASQKFILGPQVKALEEAVAKYSGCAHGVGVSSGTDALLISLMAEGIGPGDEVITTAYSFFATAGCIARLGAKPVFCDIDPLTYNLDPSKLEALLTKDQGPKTRDRGLGTRDQGLKTKNQEPRTKNCKAILPVHLFGQMADMDPIMELARKHNLVVIEDAAQAIGAECATRTRQVPGSESLVLSPNQEPRTRNQRPTSRVPGSSSPNQEPRTMNHELVRRRAGAFGELGCFSFFPSKNLGAFGDGGMVTTNDPARAEKLRILRAHGSKPKY